MSTTIPAPAAETADQRRKRLIADVAVAVGALRNLQKQGAEPLPPRFEPHFSREFPEKTGSLTIHIRDAGHFADTLAFARQHGVEEEFWACFRYLITSSLGPALAQREHLWPAQEEGADPVLIPARPARDGVLDIRPDGYQEPCFFWTQEFDGLRALHGGMICHRASRDWSLHT